MNNATAVYAAHIDVCNQLRERVLKLAGMGPHGAQARDLKDLTTAYVMALDKLASLSNTYVTSNGERVPQYPEAHAALTAAAQADAAENLGK